MSTFTPRLAQSQLLGDIPASVKRWKPGPPYGRLHLDIDLTKPIGEHQGLPVYVDETSGERFAIERNVDCGAGCRCAAEATWVPA